MRKFPIVVAVLAAVAAADPALATEVERVVTPDIFTAPPAFPAPRVYPAGYEPAVVPDVFTAPAAFPAVRLYNWTGAYVGINGGAPGAVRIGPRSPTSPAVLTISQAASSAARWATTCRPTGLSSGVWKAISPGPASGGPSPPCPASRVAKCAAIGLRPPACDSDMPSIPSCLM